MATITSALKLEHLQFVHRLSCDLHEAQRRLARDSAALARDAVKAGKETTSPDFTPAVSAAEIAATEAFITRVESTLDEATSLAAAVVDQPI